MDEAALLAQLREAVYGDPAAGWKTVCELLDAHPLSEVVLDYLQEHLAPWPDDVRDAPKHWFLGDQPNERLLLARRATEYLEESVGDAGARRIAANPYMRNIRYLSLARCKVLSDGVIALAQSPHLAAVEVFHLSHWRLKPDAIRALVASPLANGLVELGLSWSRLDNACVAILARAESHCGTSRSSGLVAMSLTRRASPP